MRIALPIWNGRIAPVFDVASRLMLADVESGTALQKWVTVLPQRPEYDGGEGLEALGVDVLVCGAISRRLEGLVRSRGISVAPFIAGEAEGVLLAWLDGRLSSETYAMPGCGRRCRRRFGGCRGRGRGRDRQIATE
jgi:predicted Fe-Mo cluster-binding NifX family protein